MTTTTTKPRPSLDQRRAEHAWRMMEAVNKSDEKPRADYTGEAHKLPVRIMASGLGQALAFLYAKRTKKPGLNQLLGDLANWVLVKRIENSFIEPQPQTTDLFRAVINADTEFLRWATEETLAYLQWINRFAEGLGLDSSTNE